MGLAAAFLILAFLGLLAAIRLAPSDPARWHVALPAGIADNLAEAEVRALTGAAVLRVPGGAETLAALDAIAVAAPRTERLAGSPDAGRITWITRSLVFGFPDYTTAEIGPDGVTLWARLRFGRSDMGVNAARLGDWLSRL
jgi:hypothetical protein